MNDRVYTVLDHRIPLKAVFLSNVGGVVPCLDRYWRHANPGVGLERISSLGSYRYSLPDSAVISGHDLVGMVKAGWRTERRKGQWEEDHYTSVSSYGDLAIGQGQLNPSRAIGRVVMSADELQAFGLLVPMHFIVRRVRIVDGFGLIVCELHNCDIPVPEKPTVELTLGREGRGIFLQAA